MIQFRTAFGRGAFQFLVTVLAIPFLLPLVIMIWLSFQGQGWQANYGAVLSQPLLPRFFLNSAIIAAGTVVLTYVATMLAAFVFAKIRLPWKTLAFYVVLAALTLPPAVLMVPLFMTVQQLGLFDTYWAVILPLSALAVPFTMLLARTYIAGLPDELLEAARIDGCGTFSAFLLIILPLTGPISAVIVVWTMLGGRHAKSGIGRSDQDRAGGLHPSGRTQTGPRTADLDAEHEASMKLNVSFNPDLVALMRTEVAAGQKAVSTTMAQAGTGLKSAWRAQITGAGLGQRLANTIRSQTYPKGRNSLDAAALVWSNAPVIIGAHDTGPLIRSGSGFWLAIPLPAAGKAQGGRRITPGMWERKTGLRLGFVYRSRGPSLLVADAVRLNTRGQAAVSKSKTGKGQVTAPIFLLVRQVKLPKRLDLARDAERALAAIPGSIVRNWVEDHL